MKHAVIIGGTGMLSGVVEYLVHQDYYCSVIARNPVRLEKLKARLGPHVLPVSVDYMGANRFKKSLQQSIEMLGPPSLAVAWIHSSAPEAIDVLADSIGNTDTPPRLFHVLGSAAESPEHLGLGKREALRGLNTIRYREVVLGFELEPEGYSRWLTHREIAGGILDAIDIDLDKYIIGQVSPWAMRPCM